MKNVERRAPRIVVPAAPPSPTEVTLVELSSSDLAVPKVHVEVLYAFEGPGCPATCQLEQGLRVALCQYREWAGRIVVEGGGDAAGDGSEKQGGDRAKTSAIGGAVMGSCGDGGGRTGPRRRRPCILLDDSAGVYLVEAAADFPLLSLTPFNPSPLLLRLIPLHRSSPHLLLAQVTRFSCGGWTLGIARHHQVADGEAASQFMQAWSRAVRSIIGSCDIPQTVAAAPPLHDRAAMMPRNPPLPTFDHLEYAAKSPPPDSSAITPPEDELVVSKFHFSLDSLRRIKAAAAEGGGGGTTYSTFVSLVAHLWRCITIARGLEDLDEASTRALVAVNVRKRIDPPLPEGFFGNAMITACASVATRELAKKPLWYAAGLIQQAIRRASGPEYVRSALDMVEVVRMRRESGTSSNKAGSGGNSSGSNSTTIATSGCGTGGTNGEEEHIGGGGEEHIGRTNKTVLSPDLSVTSWVTLPLYDLDFGNGKPLFAGNPYIPFEGLLILLPSSERDGSIDVVLGLFAAAMHKFASLCDATVPTIA